MSESKLNLKRCEPLLAAFAMDHEKSQPVEVGFFHDRNWRPGGVKSYFAKRRSLMRADLPVRSRK